MLTGDLCTDVLGRGYYPVGSLIDRLAASVDAGEIARARYCLCPGQQVGGLFRKEATAFFLVKKDDRVGWEVFALCRGDRGGGVSSSEGVRGDAGFLRFKNLGGELAVR